MKRSMKLAAAAAIVTTLAVSGAAGVAFAGDDDRWECDRRGGKHEMMKGGKHGFGPGMMGMGRGGPGFELKDYSAADIETLVKARLLRHADSGLTYNGLTATDRGTFMVSLTKADGSVVEIETSKATGAPVNKNAMRDLGFEPRKMRPGADMLPSGEVYSIEDIKLLTSAHLLRMPGKDKLVVGDVVAKAGGFYQVDIMTTNGVLVRQEEIDGRTGKPSWAGMKHGKGFGPGPHGRDDRRFDD